MLPAIIVGSVVTSSGPVPFVLHVSTGEVRLDSYQTPAHQQQQLAPEVVANIERLVRTKVPAAQQVKVGWFYCQGCLRWVDVARHCDKWTGQRCQTCGLETAS